MTPHPPTRDASHLVSQVVLQALHVLASHQGPNGEMAVAMTGEGRILEARRLPLFSCWVLEALACWSPSSKELDVMALERVPRSIRPYFVRQIEAICRRLRRFLAWQESSFGTWCFEGGRMEPDLDTTARATVVLLENAMCRPSGTRLQLRARALARLGSSVKDSSDPVALLNLFHGLILLGEEVTPLLEPLSHWTAEAMPTSRRYVGDLFFLYSLSRVWRRTQHPALEALVSSVGSRLEHTCHSEENLLSPRDTALALLTLLELEQTPLPTLAWRVLLRCSDNLGDWDEAPMLRHGAVSPACTAAWILAAVARSIPCLEDTEDA